MEKNRVLLTRVDNSIAEEIEDIVESSRDLGLTKSEVVSVILYLFFKVQGKKGKEKLRGLVIEMRKRKL
jgi:hypothetical protein